MREHCLLPGLLLLLLGACANPAPARRASPLDGLARVAAIDAGPRAMHRRLASLERMRDRVLDDLPGAAPSQAARLLDGEAARASRPLDRGERLFARELARTPALPSAWRPTSSSLGQDLADGLHRIGELLLPARLLPERDDRRHRTDPADDHPEAGWWQRLRRRLRL
jgi:hypothetical protein